MAEMGLEVAVPVCQALAARRAGVQGGAPDPQQREMVIGLWVPQLKVWTQAGKTPPPWLFMAAGCVVLYRAVVANGRPIPKQRPPAPAGDEFAPVG